MHGSYAVPILAPMSASYQMSRRHLASSLYAYGEGPLAERIPTISPEEMDHICDRVIQIAADGRLFASAEAAAAVEVLEGAARPLARSRRRLADMALADNLTFEPWPRDFWGYDHERWANAFLRLGRGPKAEEL